MNEFYQAFIATAKEAAAKNGIRWNPPCDADGKIVKSERWNLREMRGLPPQPAVWISELCYHRPGIVALNALRADKGAAPVEQAIMPADWRDFYLAATVHELLIKKNKPSHAVNTVGTPLRLLAACANDLRPWEITPDTVTEAYNAALRSGASGKAAINFAFLIRRVIDTHHLADRCPLERFCIAYADENAKAGQRLVEERKARLNNHGNLGNLRENLHDRKRESRLPEEQAFWELVRIVFTEAPKTFADAIRFAQVKLAIVTGFRVGENVVVPADWERWREYVDAKGRPAGERGGVSRSLMIRHFAEKQAADEGVEGIVLYETAQHVPPMFEHLIQETLGHVARITRPLRERLKRQMETGRFLPEYEPGEFVHAGELYPRVAGSAWVAREPIPQMLLEQYRQSYDPQSLKAIRDHQREHAEQSGWDAKTIRYYWQNLVTHGRTKRYLTPYDKHGNRIVGPIPWDNFYLCIREVEEVIRERMPTKHPDLAPYTLADGTKLYPYDLLFLLPNNCNADFKGDDVIAVDDYFSVGRAQTWDLENMLGPRPFSLFARYGETEEDRKCSMTPHSIRHLQNAELFRLGVADTIITKRFNRRSVAQSYQYDHRSLAEDLNAIDLPPVALEKLGPRALEAYRMIATDKVSGPIVDEFRRVQRDLGDDAAFEYLDAEADGLHATPYGFCLSSFTIDPCPKHLECFAGCRHLTRTDLPEEQRTLERLRDQMVRIIAKIEAAPTDTVGRKNQLRHAKERLANIETALNARPGTQPFAEGPDLSKPAEDKLGNTVLDTRKQIRRASDD